MKKRKWKSRTKHDLMIEVWAYLDLLAHYGSVSQFP